MRHILRIAAFAIAGTASAAGAQSHQVGLADLEIEDSGGQRHLDGFVWYPTEETAEASEHLGNAVWRGVDAIEDAVPVARSSPLVVLSHGMYGNAMNQAWLASELAKRGYVVAAVSHPGTSTWKRDPDDARQMWERPKDMSRVIDHVLATPELSALVDPARIFMAGHSLGGFTAVALAGGRYDAERFDGMCGRSPDELVCGIFSDWQVARSPDDRARMEADLSDPRIRGFAVFDLGGTQTFSDVSLGRIDRPMLVFGAPRNIEGTGLDLDLESRALVAALSEDTVTYQEPVTLAHFDFLGECRDGAVEILKVEEPDDVFVCIEGGAERREEHRAIVDDIAEFFEGL